MDQQQREQFRDDVFAAMDERGWSLQTTARTARIARPTMSKVTRAEHVHRMSRAKLRRVLGIEALAEVQAREVFSADIELIRDAVGVWLRDTPQEERAAKVAFLFASIANEAHRHDQVGGNL